MKDFLTNLFKTSGERIKNPLIFSFLLSWLAVNWAPIAILFLSGKEIEKRVFFLKEFYGNPINTILLPLAIALFYVLLLPYITWGLDALVKKAKSGRTGNLHNETIEKWKKRIEIAMHEHQYEQQKAGKNNLKEINDQLRVIKDQNQLLNRNNKELIEKNDSLQLELSDLKSRFSLRNLDLESDLESIDEEVDGYLQGTIDEFNLFRVNYKAVLEFKALGRLLGERDVISDEIDSNSLDYFIEFEVIYLRHKDPSYIDLTTKGKAFLRLIDELRY